MTPAGLSQTHSVMLDTSSDAVGVRGHGESGVKPIAQLELAPWPCWCSKRFACWLAVSSSMFSCNGGERMMGRVHSGWQSIRRTGGESGMRRRMWCVSGEMPAEEARAKVRRSLGVGEQGPPLLRMAQAARTANAWHTSESREQGSRGE